MTDKKQITDHLRTFFEPGDVFEIRVLDAVSPNSTWTHTESGYFEYNEIDVIPNCLDNFASYGAGPAHTLALEFQYFPQEIIVPTGSFSLASDAILEWMLLD